MPNVGVGVEEDVVWLPKLKELGADFPPQVVFGEKGWESVRGQGGSFEVQHSSLAKT